MHIIWKKCIKYSNYSAFYDTYLITFLITYILKNINLHKNPQSTNYVQALIKHNMVFCKTKGEEEKRIPLGRRKFL